MSVDLGGGGGSKGMYGKCPKKHDFFIDGLPYQNQIYDLGNPNFGQERPKNGQENGQQAPLKGISENLGLTRLLLGLSQNSIQLVGWDVP